MTEGLESNTLTIPIWPCISFAVKEMMRAQKEEESYLADLLDLLCRLFDLDLFRFARLFILLEYKGDLGSGDQRFDT